ncbi:MAG: D-glycero-beta-D-manno-heptose-7-phosphate kinase [Flammeovirgaceae bacterium]|jgi:D-glycero-beta-D-manno-heptose-7-phosphate kinase|nr:D-glycero-beta-D-manno-heptose-7-phosphate kinase [Flammeovirgaceae bacterium]|tara:strand:- start:106303 stop:107313 length:1011 start_codon:yes stop_codon:yes gene_type:complete
MQFNGLEALFEAFKELKILIIGDVMLDAYIYGSVDRISPEAPVPVLNVTSRDERLGGAANVALNVRSFGATPVLCSVIGEDLTGENFLKLISESGMSTQGMIKSDLRMTTRKNRVISTGHQLLRIDEEQSDLLCKKDQQTFLERISALLPNCNAVILQDYDKGCLDEVVIEQVIAEARRLKIPVAVDPKKRNFSHYKGATLFKPNLNELREGMKMDINPGDLDSIVKAIFALDHKISCENYLVTLSEYGVFAKNKEEEVRHPAHIRSIADVSGAGDTVIAIAALGIALNLPLAFWAELANLGGGIVCEHSGVVPIDVKLLLAEASADQILLNFFKN